MPTQFTGHKWPIRSSLPSSQTIRLPVFNNHVLKFCAVKDSRIVISCCKNRPFLFAIIVSDDTAYTYVFIHILVSLSAISSSIWINHANILRLFLASLPTVSL